MTSRCEYDAGGFDVSVIYGGVAIFLRRVVRGAILDFIPNGANYHLMWTSRGDGGVIGITKRLYGVGVRRSLPRRCIRGYWDIPMASQYGGCNPISVQAIGRLHPRYYSAQIEAGATAWALGAVSSCASSKRPNESGNSVRL